MINEREFEDLTNQLLKEAKSKLKLKTMNLT